MSSHKSTNRLFIEKLGATDSRKFVGVEGEVFYDPIEGELRLSDGKTEGGIPAEQSIVDGFGFIPEDSQLYKSVGLSSNTEYGNVYADYAVGDNEIVIGEGSEVIFDRFNHLDNISVDAIETSRLNVDGISNLGFLQNTQTVVGNINLEENTEYYSFSKELIIDPYIEILVGSGSTVTLDKLSQIEGTGGGGGTSSQWVNTSAGIHTLSKVGIGTTNPIADLQVKGDLIISAGVDTSKFITIRAYEENGGTLSFEGTEGQLFSVSNNLTSGSLFNVNDIDGNPIIDANANGNLGIGTTNPQYKLDVGGDLNLTGTLYQNGVAFSGGGGAFSYCCTSNITSTNLTFHPDIATANYNFFAGCGAGCSITSGNSNNFLGFSAGRDNTTGYYNNFFGSNAGERNTSGYGNNFFGALAGGYNITGSNNNFLGYYAGKNNTTGCYNNFFGVFTGRSNTTGYANNYLGPSAGRYNTIGCGNNFFGASAGASNVSGSYNNFFGLSAGASNVSGNFNNFFGYEAGFRNTTGDHNTFLGSHSGISTSSSNKIILGRGFNQNNLFDSPNTTKDKQFAVGINTTGTSEYWLVGNENFNIGIGTTNPVDKLTVQSGDIRVGVNTSNGLILTDANGVSWRLIVNTDGTLSTAAV